MNESGFVSCVLDHVKTVGKDVGCSFWLWFVEKKALLDGVDVGGCEDGAFVLDDVSVVADEVGGVAEETEGGADGGGPGAEDVGGVGAPVGGAGPIV